VLFLQPREQTITFLYDIELSEKSFRVFESRFYSEDNIAGLVRELQANNLEDYAQKLAAVQGRQNFKKIISFAILPGYFEIATSTSTKDIDEMQKIQQVKGTLLQMHLVATSKEDLQKASVIFRKNLEEVIPLHSQREELNQNIIACKERLASIEETKYTLNLQLERKRATLEKLKKLGSAGLDKLPGDNIVLQFNNVGDSSAYLPLPYQMQAAETQIINLEEQIQADKEWYDYYISLLKLDEKLFSHLNKAMYSGYTSGQFRLFLIDTLAGYNDNTQITDYLKAYIKKIENKMATTTPLVEKPMISPVAKGTIKKSGIIFALLLVTAVFAAFLLESFEKNKTRVL
jgi:hypothetical protein